MSDDFPLDDYTPHGILANPAAFARSWTDGDGGTVRTCEQDLGIGWRFPWATRPTLKQDLAIALSIDGQLLEGWEAFLEAGLKTTWHSSTRLGYELVWRGVKFHVQFGVFNASVLRVQILVTKLDEQTGVVEVRLLPRLWEVRPNGPPRVRRRMRVLRRRMDVRPIGHRWRIMRWSSRDGQLSWSLSGARVDPVISDADFWAAAPRLEGDWPDHWRRGLVYDLETTRMCLQAPGGIFRDVWPAWMVNWPRAVLAEGTLDMLRLSYAAPELAQRAILSLFRDTPGDQIPCVFRGGEPNMVAADGSICGTSPAWCVPFYNIRLLYLRTLDRVWLDRLYPYLADYLEWWIDHRSDADGWTVYRCTWESGEDDNYRLDPQGTGDNVISGLVRPVELQASIAYSVATLAFFAQELGREADLPRWRRYQREALLRLERLWDSSEGRYRDWDVRRNAFLAPRGRSDYMGTDPGRFSALSLTPILFGQASPGRLRRLRPELEQYDCPPWCEWPSWSYVVLEAASAAGWLGFASQMATRIVDRVYRQNDRRDLGSGAAPLPGVASEYWPLDQSTWRGSDGYGWGATTAQLAIRQIFGLFESQDPTGLRFELAPALPKELLVQGREFRLGPLPYRGAVLRSGYRCLGGGRLEALVGTESREVRVRNSRGEAVPVRFADGAACFAVRNFERLQVEILHR